MIKESRALIVVADVVESPAERVFTNYETRLVYFMFFLSGFSALVYEVAWLSRIQLVMGHTVYSLATTLAAYLTGIAVGSWCVGRILQSGLPPLTLYVVAEGIIGLYGLGFTLLLALVQIPYDSLVSLTSLSLPVLSLVQFVICGAVIFIPTVLMGTTLPLLAAALGGRGSVIARNLPTLYGINTFGAVLGSLVAGFLFLPSLGYERSIWLAAGINLLIVLMAGTGAVPVSIPRLQELQAAFRRILHSKQEKLFFHASEKNAVFLLFISGFASMFVQFLWNRLGALGFGPSTYIFPLVTSVVLMGIVGGAIIARRCRFHQTTALLWLPLFAALSLLGGNALLSQTPAFVLNLHQSREWGFSELMVVQWFWLLLCCGPAATFLGAVFPVAAAVLVKNQEQGSRALGYGYALNIFGFISGSILGSFLFMPLLGIEAMGRFLAVVLALSCSITALTATWRPLTAVTSVLLMAVALKVTPHFDRGLLTAGYFYNRTPHLSKQSLNEMGFRNMLDYSRSQEPTVVAYRDDPHATVSIHRGVRDTKDVAFKINGKVDGNNSSDLQTTKFVALLPLLMKPEAAKILTIGFGTGSTVTETLKYPGVRQTTVIELSNAMLEFSKENFADINGKLWADARFRAINRDGRDFLEHTREKFDLIISEPSNPWVEGVGSLFTEEYYRSISKRLSPGGVASLWFHSYGLDCVAVGSVLSAVKEVFPTVHVFKLGGDLYMLAANESRGLIHETLTEEAQSAEAALFQVAGVSGLETNRENAYRQFMNKTYLFNRSSVARYTAHTTPNRDDNQTLQYLSGRTFFTGVSCGNFHVFTRASDIDEALLNLGRSLASPQYASPQ